MVQWIDTGVSILSRVLVIIRRVRISIRTRASGEE